MTLGEGEYLGTVRRNIDLPGCRLSLTDYLGDRRHEWHTHANPTFFLLARGQHLDETDSGLSEQGLLSVNYHPTTCTHRSVIGQHGMVGLNLELTPEWFDQHGLQDRDLGVARIDTCPRLACLAVKLVVYAQGESDHGVMNSMVLDLIQPFLQISDFSEDRMPKWLAQAQSYLDAEFRHGASLASAARFAGVHPVHLARTYLAFFGSTVTERLHYLRMAEASRLMLEGMSAGAAALEVGFSDQFYMSRRFKGRLGITPQAIQNAAAR